MVLSGPHAMSIPTLTPSFAAAPRQSLAWEFALVRELALRDVRLSHRGALLGAAWSVANPLLLMGVYTLVFAVILTPAVPDYPAFLLAGLVPWTCFASAVASTSAALVAHLPLLRAHAVPPRVFPVAASLAAVPGLALAISLFALVRVAQGLPAAALAGLPLVIAVQLVLTTGLGLVLAAAGALVRDVHAALHFALRLGFFVTPIVYAPSQVPAHLAGLVSANPLAGLIDAYRRVLLDGRLPDPAALAPALALGLAAAACGLALEARVRPRLAEAA
jgi:ABC-type polysaccharide/polyol phosphate export permease